MSSTVTLLVVPLPGEAGSNLDLLSPGEITRAARFTVEHPRRVFVTARAALRRALGTWLSLDPAAFVFLLGPHGKPRLDPPSSLRFNLSHSGDSIVIALTEGIDLGVDVEELDRHTPTERLARRFFTQAEARAVEQAPEADRNRIFFHCWTAKEAVLKATGSGLTVPVREVEVDPDPDAPPRLLNLGGDTTEAERWTLLRHEVPGRWIATVAFRGETRTLIVKHSLSVKE